MPTMKAPQFAPEVDAQVQVTHMKVAGVSQPEDRHLSKAVSRSQPFLLDGDFLLVTNNSDEPAVFRWNRKVYVIDGGASKHVPFEALVDALGDPRSMDNEVVKFNDGNGTRGVVMERHSELSRLFGRYAVENEDIEELVKRTPKVSVTTMNDERVTFPGLRPDMLPMPAPMIDDKAVNTDTTQMFDRLAAENAELREKQQIMEDRMNALVEAREGVSSGN